MSGGLTDQIVRRARPGGQDHHPPELRAYKGEAMSRLQKAIERDVERKLYDGAVTIVAVGGKVVLREAIGYADRLAGKPMAAGQRLPRVLDLQVAQRGTSCCNRLNAARCG